MKNRGAHLFLPAIMAFLWWCEAPACLAQELKTGYYPEGQLRYKGYFADGKPVGELLRYYPEGNVKARMNHRGDTVAVTFYSRSGEYTTIGTYVGRRKTGIWKYAKGDVLLAEEEYRDDKLEGISKRYGKDGEMLEQKCWKNEQPEGEWLLFYENGKLRLQGFYLAGKLEGLLKTYSPEGKLRTKGIYKDNLKEGEWEYYDWEGRLDRKVVYHAGIPEHAEERELEESRKLDSLIHSGGKIPDPAHFTDDPEAYMKLSGME